VCIVQSPRDSVEHASDTVLRDAPPKQGIALKGAESVVLDLRVCGRRALPDEVEVDVGSQWGRVEEDQPDVDAQFGLHHQIVSNWRGFYGECVTGYAGGVVPCPRYSRGCPW
jgi:hypothetical protein